MHHGPLRHSSFPVYLSREREEQLFGSPSPGGNVVGAAFDLPELYSACRDLTTAAGVNRALAQVFRLLAQRRISRQEAATFGHLAQLLLRTITLAHAESVDAPAVSAHANATGPVILSEQRERRISPQPAPELDISFPPSPVCEHVPCGHPGTAPPHQTSFATEMKSTLTKTLNLKPFRMNTYRKTGGPRGRAKVHPRDELSRVTIDVGFDYASHKSLLEGGNDSPGRQTRMDR